MSNLFCPNCGNKVFPEPEITWDQWKLMPVRKLLLVGYVGFVFESPQLLLLMEILIRGGGHQMSVKQIQSVLFPPIVAQPTNKSTVRVAVARLRKCLNSIGYQNAIKTNFAAGYSLRKVEQAK